MFEGVTNKQGRGRTRRGAFVVLSAVVQGAIIVGLILIADRLHAAATGTEPIVEVKFIKTAPAAPSAPPPPAPRREPPPQARKATAPKPSPPTALVQPQKSAPLPEPTPSAVPPEETSGNEGGVVGGTPGVSGPAQPGVGASSDAPTFAKPGYRLPRLAEETCIQKSIEDVPKELVRTVSGKVMVRFAVSGNGQPALFQVLTPLHDARVGDAIWRAVTSCQWVPGADASGQPAAIWVVLPFRFN